MSGSAIGPHFLLSSSLQLTRVRRFDLFGAFTFAISAVLVLYTKTAPGLAAIVLVQAEAIITGVYFGIMEYVRVSELSLIPVVFSLIRFVARKCDEFSSTHLGVHQPSAWYSALFLQFTQQETDTPVARTTSSCSQLARSVADSE